MFLIRLFIEKNTYEEGCPFPQTVRSYQQLIHMKNAIMWIDCV